jgi:hypothetical protein
MLASFSFLALFALAVPPALKDGYFTNVVFESDTVYNLLMLKMDFDQDIYMRNLTAITPLSGMLHPSPRTGFPQLTHNGIGR